MIKEIYREALKKEFPQLTDKMIDKSCLCCPEHFFDGDNVPCYADCNENTVEEVCSKCWDKPCEGTYNGDPFDPSDWEDELPGNQPTAPEEPEEDPEPEISDEEFVQQKSELKEAIAVISDKSIKCPHWCKGETVKYKDFGAVDFECTVHKESFCDFCGKAAEYEYKSGKYCCDKCLDRAALDGTRITNEDAVVEFVKTYGDEFHEFLREWYS